MTVLTGGSVSLAGFQRKTVNAGAITVGLPLMACCAIHRSKNFVVVRVFHRRVCVAIDAGIRSMSRGDEFCTIDKQGNCLSRGIGFEEAFVGMAIEAVAIFHASGGVEGY
jgi:hypothetical protein